MELWIRTQNREALIKTNIIKWENGCLRGATDEDGWYQDLGKYKKKRAIEVLDEIQNLLQPKIIYTQKEPIETYELGVYQLKQDVDIKIQEVNRIVYEMPQD